MPPRIRSRALLATLLLAMAPAATTQPASDPTGAPPPTTGRQIMLRVDGRPQGRDQSVAAVWELISRSGRTRTRKTRFYRRQEPSDSGGLLSRWLLVFDSPPDLKDTALLVWNPRAPEQPADQWIYMAAYRKVRRIAGNARSTAFMGTDFAFEDITERAVDHDEHELLRTESVDGSPQYIVASTPHPGTSDYSKRVHWVDAASWTVQRIDFHGRKGTLRKSLRLHWVEKDSIWVWRRLEMIDHRTQTRTIVDVADVRVDTGLRAELFEPGSLAATGR